GVINIVTGSSAVIGEAIMNNQKVRKMTFTGSTEVGEKLMEQGSKQRKKLSLELGGHAPIIVFDDANLDRAVEGSIASKYRNAGQTCVCGNRIFVQETVYDEFIEKFSRKVKELKI